MTYTTQQIFDKAIDIFKSDPNGRGHGDCVTCLLGQLNQAGYCSDRHHSYAWHSVDSRWSPLETMLHKMEKIYEGWGLSSIEHVKAGGIKACYNWQNRMILLGREMSLDTSKLTDEVSKSEALKFLETVEC